MRRRHDIAVIGGGTAGSIVAARLAVEAGLSVVLIEHGPVDSLDAPLDPFPGLEAGLGVESIAVELGSDLAPGAVGTLHAPRRLGGGSAVNGSISTLADPADYDRWERDHGCAGWSWRDLVADAGAVGAALPALSAPPGAVGDALTTALAGSRPAPLAVRRDGDGSLVRVTPAGALLPAALDSGRLEIVRAAADRLRDDGDDVAIVTDTGAEIAARGVVVCAGALATPRLLARSGVEHRRLGADLATHPAVMLVLDRGPGGAPGGTPPVSVTCPVTVAVGAEEVRGEVIAFEHIDASRRWAGVAAVLFDVASRGTLDPHDGGPPRLAMLSGGIDRRALVEIVRVALRAADAVESCGVGTLATGDADLAPEAHPSVLDKWLTKRLWPLAHVVGTCAMGRDGVVDEHGQVRGRRRTWVADASVMPRLVAAHPNLTVAVVARRIAGFVAEEMA